jgi:acetamidase/formamidase
MNLMFNTGRINGQARIVAHHYPFDMHFTRALVNLNIGDPRSPCRAKSWPLTMHIAGPGDALSVQNIALCALLLWLVMRFPAGFGGSRLL